jgi:4-hydroxybenzoate polyprenyltransferase
VDERRGIAVVKTLQHIIHFGRLIRYPNLLIIALTQALIRWSLMDPLLGAAHLTLQMSFFLFVMLMLSTLMVTAGGYAINDYFDRKIDTVNNPGQVVVGRTISLRHTMAIHLLLTSAGVLLGLYVAYSIGFLYLGFLFVMGSGMLWFYSTTYKRQVFIGNLIVALMTGMIPMLVLLFELPLLYRKYGVLLAEGALDLTYLAIWVGGFSAFAFLLTLAREIIKDAEDIKGDTSFGRQTLPSFAGMRVSKGIVVFLLSLTALALFYVSRFLLPDRLTLIYMLVFLITPLAINIWLVIRADSSVRFHWASLLTKWIMVAGLLYTLLANYLLHHLK